MLRTLLTPLVARFDLSPRNPTQDLPQTAEDDNEIDPEEFARDVMVELMRNSVDNLKMAEEGPVQVQVLSEMQRIMAQDANTKDVFRELDGFLILMSLLSTIQDRQSSSGTAAEPKDQLLSETLEITRLIFVNLDEAMHGSSQNTAYFQSTVTYASLASSLTGLLSHPVLTDHTLGLLLSLSLHDFTLSSTFDSLRTVSEDDLDFEVSKLEPTLKTSTIERPEAILILWNSVQSSAIPTEDKVVRYVTYKIFELLSKTSHRNLAVLSSLETLVGSVLNRFAETRPDNEDNEANGKPEDASSKGKGKTIQEKERHVLQKLLRRLLDMGAGTKEARMIFQRAIKGNGEEGLDAEMLDLLRFGMKSRWLEHFSLEGEKAAMVLEESEAAKALPGAGFTFMMWMWISSVPTSGYSLFTIKLTPSPTSTPLSKSKPENLSKTVLSLKLRPDGSLEFSSTANKEPVIFEKAKFQRSRWTHVALVHYPHRNSNPSIRLFIDGVLLDAVNWGYPKLDWKDAQMRSNFVVGDLQGVAKMSWCLASAYLVALPLGDDVPRFIHHLGARYNSNFQDPALVKFLTYEASTSLNMFLTTVAAQHQGQHFPQSSPSSALMKIVQNGLSIPENAILFSVSALNAEEGGLVTTVPLNSTSGSGGGGENRAFKVQGDVFAAKAKCLDMALWKVGGAGVALRLVQVANSQHELSRALGVLTDGLRNNWQNSEDMERLHGYDILGDILRAKSQLINITGFETLFEFLGLNFRTPEQSAVVNIIAYRAIALDFELWSQTKKDIQQLYLEHFVTLLETSRYRKFNSRQRLAKQDLVRKLLFALQTSWYDDTMVGSLMESLKAAMQANFAKEETIKPVITYITANLHQEPRGGAASPRSTISRIDYIHPREKAEQVLDILISLLSIQAFHTKFAAALPLTRICLLLLGDKPSPLIANRVLTLIGISNTFTTSFSRKFELVSGWSVLKTVLPYCWDSSVNQAAFDVMLGRYNHVLDKSLKRGAGSEVNVVVCPSILPAILASLSHGLAEVAKGLEEGQRLDVSSPLSSPALESDMETLVEQMMHLHASSSTFRQIFKSQQTTQILIDGLKAFVNDASSASGLNQPTRRILEKVTHLGLAIALDPTIGGGQKREILDSVQKGDAVLNPTSDKLSIDPSLIEDTRTVRQRIASARFSIHVNERTVIKTISRMQEWRKTIEVSEKKRLRKTLLDLRETRRQVASMYDWTNVLTSERGLWPSHETRLWRLDETEGPYRVRKKLEPQNDESSTSRVDGQDEETRKVTEPETETASLHQAEVPPWAEGYEISSTETDDKLAEDVSDDKHRRIRHELEPGDVIEAISTVARIVGVDSSPGLLIIGRTHIYILDGLVENDDGEVVEAHDAPKRLFFVPGSIVELDGPQRAQRWHHDQISSYSEKTFLFRDVALELYFKDSRSLLVTFLDKKKRAEVDQRLSGILHHTSSENAITPGLPKTPMFGAKSISWRSDQLSTAQRKWQAREISNFTYLCILNQVSGRTPSDATQYPVFPWVIADYTSQTLDFLSPETFRDMTKPMGALTNARREAAETRYTNLESVEEEPFHYGTHFSSSMIVCHYLIRLAPFTNMFKTLQGGDWDLPDRLFTDISRAYESASSDVRGDVRELIPEFYTCPEFLENAANLDFGVQQNTGERIHDVKLPPWARNDPLLFIVMNRRALESAYVSEHLPAWIDLIWGCKQRDPTALNVFHPLSYEGSIDLDTITDDLEREAKVGIIHNFGQTPRKLFDTPHPERNNHGLPSLPLGTLHGIEEDPHLLLQGARCFKDLGPDTPVLQLAVDIVGNKIIPCPAGVLTVPTHPHEQVEWKEKGSELRVLVDHKVVQVVENACCTCVAFADGNTIVTGSSDFTVRLWKLSRSSGAFGPPTRISLSHIMRIHTDKVLCVTASRTWSMVVSGSDDGSAALWDLNRGVYVRSIWHATEGAADEMTAVNLVAINESTGYIATCSRSILYLHTINARPIAKLDLTTTSSYSKLVPTITALAFHEREFSNLGVLATGGADGTIVLRTWTADGTPEGEKAQWEFVTIRSMKARMVGRGVTRPPSITALRFSGETLIHGEETGKSYVWSLPDS